ncbi:hypothetical protein GG344DRAFT_82100 [Lentinula edodes]|nr:hypothetical protein GG344DRAFT_82100 [Lentinula edodes]
MALKRKASSTSIQDSPSKRTRSKVAPSTPSIATGSSRKSRAPKPSVPANDLSDNSSDDGLNIIDQEPSPSKQARSNNYRKQRTEDRAAHPLLQAKVVQLKTPSLTSTPPFLHLSMFLLPSALLPDMLLKETCPIIFLRALQHPPVIESEDASERSTNEIAMEKLSDLLDGTATRGEGNSCLLLGPRGSGKTQTIELCISNQSVPHVDCSPKLSISLSPCLPSIGQTVTGTLLLPLRCFTSMFVMPFASQPSSQCNFVVKASAWFAAQEKCFWL